ncbi:phosphotransferase [Neobacillus jeddahensis]|uniref:phosphotransferase n=1 Tax=Neobacillus jeddahensis TaxID=1461580 RepID=UPI00058ABFDE|nr:phosphotransferase [Neobacillus jeddahensis]
MDLPANLVLQDGTLNEQLILKRETLYQGMNGRLIERFYLNPTTSLIFKPLTNNGQIGKEVWINEQVLPLLPAIYPKIFSYSIHEDPNLNWMILEDLGKLLHEFHEELVLRVARSAAGWHSLSLEKLIGVPEIGLKPPFVDVVAEIRSRKEELLLLVPLLNLKEEDLHQLYALLDQVVFSDRLVLSHGDLHVGNFAVVRDQLMILDWEHAHLSMPYWDLYHLIDMSHPLFPKKVTSALRENALNAYLDRVDFVVDRDMFSQEYYLFSAVFSMWMLLLIQKDLQGNGGKWSIEQLKAQFQETAASLGQCLEALSKKS